MMIHTNAHGIQHGIHTYFNVYEIMNERDYNAQTESTHKI